MQLFSSNEALKVILGVRLDCDELGHAKGVEVRSHLKDNAQTAAPFVRMVRIDSDLHLGRRFYLPAKSCPGNASDLGLKSTVNELTQFGFIGSRRREVVPNTKGLVVVFGGNKTA